MAERDFEGAVEKFRDALDGLPDAPVTEERRQEYTEYFAATSVERARQLAEEGRYTEAIEMAADVLEPRSGSRECGRSETASGSQ